MGRETHPSQGFHPSDVQNASVVLCFATRNAPLSKISPFGRRKCKRGAHFCIARYTPIEDFVLRTGTDKHTNIQTHGLTNMQTYKHDAKYYSIVGHGVGGMPRSAILVEAAKRPSIHIYSSVAHRTMYTFHSNRALPIRLHLGSKDTLFRSSA